MRINHNLMAMNTHRMLGINQQGTSKSIEKLSSGYRINRAGDDAAGLAISEKMRAQVRGLNQASRNSQDGISLIQTAEGALNETHDILQRMRELAVQSASDTNVAIDREAIQEEVDALATEITRISNNTEFNERKLLDGGLQTGNIDELTFQIGANATQNMEISITAMDAQTLGVAGSSTTAALATGATHASSVELADNIGTAVVDGASLALTTTATADEVAWSAATSGITGTILEGTSDSSDYNDWTITTTKSLSSGADVTAVLNTSAKTITLNFASDVDSDNSSATAVKINSALTTAGITDIDATGDATAVVATADAGASTMGLAADEVAMTIGSETLYISDSSTSATFTSAANKGLTVNFDGSTLDATTAATINITEEVSTAATFASGALDNAAVTKAGLDISTQSAADTAITTLNTAITTVSTQRAKLGAVQNRLEHTIKNLDTSSENLQASESRIRDVDMAKEMMEFTKNNILQQAAQSMLAQANNQPQGILQLLR